MAFQRPRHIDPSTFPFLIWGWWPILHRNKLLKQVLVLDLLSPDLVVQYY